MIDYSTDILVGDMILGDDMLTNEGVSSCIHEKTGCLLSAKSNGTYQKLKDLPLSIAFVDVNQLQYSSSLSIPDMLYVLQHGKQLNGLGNRVVSCGTAVLSDDAINKISVDNGFKSIEISEDNREYIFKDLDVDQANFIKWGTFKFSDSLYGVGDMSCIVKSMTLKPHSGGSSTPFHGINGYLAIYQYDPISGDTPDIDENFNRWSYTPLVARSVNSVSVYTSTDGNYRPVDEHGNIVNSIVYNFGTGNPSDGVLSIGLPIYPHKKYIYRVVDENLNNRKVVDPEVETKYDPHGSFRMI